MCILYHQIIIDLVHEYYGCVFKSILQVGGSHSTCLLKLFKHFHFFHFCVYRRFYFNMNVFTPVVIIIIIYWKKQVTNVHAYQFRQ